MTPTSHRRGSLSRERIVRAALDLAESDGIDQVSLHKIGAALGVQAMSLYRYVSDKADLYDAMGDAVLDEVPTTTPPGASWETDIAHLGHAFRAVILRYPHSAPLVLVRRLNSPSAEPLALAGLEVLARAGFDPLGAAQGLRALIALLVGTLVRETTMISRGTAADGRGHPASPDLATIDHEAEFENALDFAIQGLRGRLATGGLGRVTPPL